MKRESKNMTKLWTAALAGIVSVAMIGCSQPPELPPEDSMELPAFLEGAESNNPSATTDNVSAAALAVGGVTVVLNLYLAAPRAMFIGTLQADPYQDGNEWVWERTYPLLGVSGQLRGSVDESLNVSMIVNGEREGIDLDNFVWYTGVHNARDGQWLLYAPEYQSGPVISVDWDRQSAVDKTVVFTNVTSGEAGSGDSLTYDLLDTTATFQIYDADDGTGAPATFTVQWDVVDGSGIMTYDGVDYCWDTLENGQVDIPCN